MPLTAFSFHVEDKMTDLSLGEKKKLLMEARAARKGQGGPAENMSDLSGLETRSTKRKKP